MNNLHLIHTILEVVKDNNQAALINLDHPMVFNRVDHQYLAAVLQVTRFKNNFCKWISLLHCSTSAMVQVNGKCLCAFVLSSLVSSGLFAVATTSSFGIGTSPLLAKGQDVQSSPTWNYCPWWSSMMYPFSCRAAAILQWYRRYLNDLRMSQVPRLTATSLPSWQLGAWMGVDLLKPFSWTDRSSAFLEWSSGQISSWRKYRQRLEWWSRLGSAGGCP